MTGSDVRQLDGEDLDRLGWTDPHERSRSLGEAQTLAREVDELDYLAACTGDRVVGIGAAGYTVPLGGASLVSLSVDPDPPGGRAPDPAAALLVHLEQRATELACASIEVRVDAADPDTRAVLERHGYGLVGAVTTVVPASTGDGGEVGARRVDSWVLRKQL